MKSAWVHSWKQSYSHTFPVNMYLNNAFFGAFSIQSNFLAQNKQNEQACNEIETENCYLPRSISLLHGFAHITHCFHIAWMHTGRHSILKWKQGSNLTLMITYKKTKTLRYSAHKSTWICSFLFMWVNTKMCLRKIVKVALLFPIN